MIVLRCIYESVRNKKWKSSVLASPRMTSQTIHHQQRSCSVITHIYCFGQKYTSSLVIMTKEIHEIIKKCSYLDHSCEKLSTITNQKCSYLKYCF